VYKYLTGSVMTEVSNVSNKNTVKLLTTVIINQTHRNFAITFDVLAK